MTDTFYVLVKTTHYDKGGVTEVNIYADHDMAVEAGRNMVIDLIDGDELLTVPAWCKSNDDVIQWYNESNYHGNVVDVYPTRLHGNAETYQPCPYGCGRQGYDCHH